jgi:hypothetical protein
MDLDLGTRRIHLQVAVPEACRLLATPTYSGSTTYCASAADVTADCDRHAGATAMACMAR